MSYLPPIFQQNNQYSARVTRQLLDDVATPGVVGAAAFAVTERAAGAAMAVDVAAGRAYIRGTDQANQGLYLCITEATVEVPVEPADPSLGRIDLVVAEVRDPNAGGVAGDDWQFRVIEGTPDAAPVVPSVPDSAIALAEIVVGAGVTSILDVNLTDRRAFSDAKSGGLGFQYAGTRYYTSSGTFLKADPLGTGDIGLRAIRVRVLGGGGAAGSSGATGQAGGGGGAGGYAERFFTDIAALDATITVTRGAGGASGGGGDNDGSSGVTSEFGELGDAWRTRAAGGEFGFKGSTPAGGLGGLGLDGDLLIGGSGGAAGSTAATSGAGAGGSSMLGGGGRGRRGNTVGSGETPGGFGGGGAGGVNGANGGAGANGIVIVDCFI